MRKFRVIVQGAPHEVTVLRKQGSEISFTHNEIPYLVNVEPLYEAPEASKGAPIATASMSSARRSGSVAHPNEVVSPMPGVVVSIAVQKGDRVTLGQTVCVVEAMKMENNIACHKDGTVEEILCSAGKEVSGGEALIRIRD